MICSSPAVSMEEVRVAWNRFRLLNPDEYGLISRDVFRRPPYSNNIFCKQVCVGEGRGRGRGGRGRGEEGGGRRGRGRGRGGRGSCANALYHVHLYSRVAKDVAMEICPCP